MKQLLSLMSMMMLLTTLAFAQPAMEFEATTVDYGKIEQDADPYRVFKFKNTGNEALIITNAKGSCGCTVPTYPKEPIAPGQSAEIKVRYDTKRIGKINKTVTLQTNAGVKVLKIAGEVYAKTEAPATPKTGGGSILDQ